MICSDEHRGTRAFVTLLGGRRTEERCRQTTSYFCLSSGWTRIIAPLAARPRQGSESDDPHASRQVHTLGIIFLGCNLNGVRRRGALLLHAQINMLLGSLALDPSLQPWPTFSMFLPETSVEGTKLSDQCIENSNSSFMARILRLDIMSHIL